ncbi:MAG: sarcosine oxidase subunit gamma family protein [Pseudomonadota bacterium]
MLETTMTGAAASPLAEISRIDTLGMVSLKADLSDPAVASALAALTGVGVPMPLTIWEAERHATVWMAPDEVLILCPAAEAAGAVAALDASLSGHHALALDVSAARAAFRIAGPGAREVLAKGAPLDLRPGVFTPGTARRTQLGQVAVGLWLGQDEAFTLVCFRSLAAYVTAWLEEAAHPGGAVDHF